MTADTAASPDAAQTPLRPEDFDTLDAALDAMRAHDGHVPEWEFCEGFMAALVCTRRAIAPVEYWPALLGDFEPMRQMEFVWLWRRRWREIERALDAEVESFDDPRCYQPELIDARGAIAELPPGEQAALADEDIPSYAQLWALGFLAAVEHWGEDWTAPRDREAAAMLEDALAAVGALAGDDTGQPVLSMFREDGPPTVSQRRLDAVDAAVWAVYDLRRLWKSLGPRAGTARRPVMPGRNDPCPCGSGMKYKKCHGAGGSSGA